MNCFLQELEKIKNLYRWGYLSERYKDEFIAKIGEDFYFNKNPIVAFLLSSKTNQVKPYLNVLWAVFNKNYLNFTLSEEEREEVMSATHAQTTFLNLTIKKRYVNHEITYKQADELGMLYQKQYNVELRNKIKSTVGINQ